VIFVGFQPRGTVGRQTVEGVKRVNIFGEETVVQAQVWTVNGFSAHTDQPILINWLKKADARRFSSCTAKRSHLRGSRRRLGRNS
jgi:metallo-beta-lactamase family protein